MDVEVYIMWCKVCERETFEKKCEICGTETEDDIPVEIYWCGSCRTPVIMQLQQNMDKTCPLCGGKIKRMGTDLRPVFPEERLLIEILVAEPFTYLEKSVWAVNSRYYIDGKSMPISIKQFSTANVDRIIHLLEENRGRNTYEYFNCDVERFIRANHLRLAYLKDEAFSFIRSVSEKYTDEQIVLSFSGGKDSTVTADLAVRALSNPSLVHIFGNTTLEFPLTIKYAKRFRKENPKAIFRVAQNKEQDFYNVCSDIGPPARMLRWCCTMFKTGPITRVLNSMFRNNHVLTFYGIRKSESVSRSKYKRIEDDASSIKIQKQTVASPVFLWRDIDIWLYILSEKIDFNDAYRLGYDRVGCWCCPNNNARAQFLSQIYMPEQVKKWHEFLVDFAKKIGKPDPEEYVDSGNWKRRQGGKGVRAAEDVKLKFTNCTAEENAQIYRLNKPITDEFINMFIPFGIISKELGRKMLREVLVLDMATKVPILSIQPFAQNGYEYAVKIKTTNVANHEDLQRMAGYQVRKYNACRRCLKCESLCAHGAITINSDGYYINPDKCKRCKMCVTAKYLDGGCLMDKFLKTVKESS